MMKARMRFRWIPILLALGASTGVSAQDGPQFRTIDGRQAVVSNTPATQALKADVVPGGGAVAGAEVAGADAGAVAIGEKGQKSLPVSDITLPAPRMASKEKKAELAAAVSRILKDGAMVRTTVGIQIIDMDSGEMLYEKDPDKALKPASNMKLLTTAAALYILGADHQFETLVYAEGKIEKGVLRGDLHMHIGHDFTWSTRFYESGDTPMAGLIQQIRKLGIKSVTGKVIVSGHVVYGGEATGTLSTAAHLQKAGQRFSTLLRNQQITHGGLAVRQTAKPSGEVIAKWRSPVLSEAIVPINRASHNEYSDLLLIALGWHHSKKNTYEAGSKAIMEWLKTMDLPTKGIVIADGSGLSHDNRLSATFLNALTLRMLRSPYAREWAASMSIAGFDGTYGGRLATNDAKGRVYAKSGTLRDVISGSGFFVNAQDGRTYAFSIIVNDMRQKKNTRLAIDRIVRVFLNDNYGVSRPEVPMMASFRREADGRVMARWEAVAGAVGYRVYRSEDGHVWEKCAETKDTALVMPNAPAHIRLTAVSDKGGESNTSLVFSYRPGEKRMTIVDQARCRADSSMRPTNHIFTHERPLASVVPNDWGVETVRYAADLPNADGYLWHDVACGGRLAIDESALSSVVAKDVPILVNLVDAHQVSLPNECAPKEGKILGCFKDPVISMDRRLGDERQENQRLKKAAGSGSSRPTQVALWKGASTCLTMAGMPVAACEKSGEQKAYVLTGVDLQALDSQKTSDAVWKMLMNP